MRDLLFWECNACLAMGMWTAASKPLTADPAEINELTHTINRIAQGRHRDISPFCDGVISWHIEREIDEDA